MEIRFSELRGKKAFNGSGDFLGEIANIVIEPKTELAFVLTMRSEGRNVGGSLIPIGRLKNIDEDEIIFAINNIPPAEFPAEYDSFLSDRTNPGAMNSQIYSLNKKTVLGSIYDYILDIETGKRTAILIEEVTIGRKRKFLVPTESAHCFEDTIVKLKKILIDPARLQEIKG